MIEALKKLKDIALAVTLAAESGTLEQVLESIARVSQELAGAKYAALGIPDGKGGLRYFKVAGMTSEQTKQVGHLPTGKGLIGAIIDERKTLRLDTMQDDPRSAGFCAGHPGMTSLLGVPVQVGSRLFGTLYLCDRVDGQPFSEQDQWLIETLAGYAALAIAGSQLGEQQSRVVLLEERERIAMELHDGIIQSLYAIGMQLDLARSSDAITPGDLSPSISALNAVIDDVRSYILDLKSRESTRKTIYATLHEMVQRMHVPDTHKVSIIAPDEYPPFTPGIFEGITQIVNEAFSNAIRHADATQITIATSQDDRAFELTITDNGQSFDLDTARGGSGLGLRNIQQRALMYGGQLSIEAQPGKGTRIHLRLPL